SPTDVAANISAGAMPPEANVAAALPVPRIQYSKWNRALRSDVYDELLKLPLRYKLHDFAKLCPPQRCQEEPEAVGVVGRDSAVGYLPPLGPADPLDTIPFFVHRSSNGVLPGKVFSMHPRNLMPAFYLRIQQVEGDMFRFEEELLKIFPTKKIFVRSHSIYVYNVALDGRMVLHHWLLGLGF
nr:Chain Al, mL49 [Trypanosoma brucei]